MRSLPTLMGAFLLLAFISQSALATVVVSGEASVGLKTNLSDVLGPVADGEEGGGVGEQEAFDEPDADDESEGELLPATWRRPLKGKCYYSRRHRKVTCSPPKGIGRPRKPLELS